MTHVDAYTRRSFTCPAYLRLETPRLLSPDADDGIKGEMLPGVTLLDVTLLEVIYVTRM